MVTVPGGQTIDTTGLSALQQQQLADGLAKLAGEGFTSSNIITSLNQAPVTTPGPIILIRRNLLLGFGSAVPAGGVPGSLGSSVIVTAHSRLSLSLNAQ